MLVAPAEPLLVGCPPDWVPDGEGEPEPLCDGEPDWGDGDPDCGDGEPDCGDPDWGDGELDCGGGLPDWPVGGGGCCGG